MFFVEPLYTGSPVLQRRPRGLAPRRWADYKDAEEQKGGDSERKKGWMYSVSFQGGHVGPNDVFRSEGG